jgi:transposase
VTRDRFVCPLCGHEVHADINAARNILALGRAHWAALRTTPVERRWQPVEASALSAPLKQEAKIKG